MMKLLTVILKPFRAEAVLQSLDQLGVSVCIVREVKGYSRQKDYLSRYVGSEYSMAFLPKVEITFSVPDDRVDEVAERVVGIARTGRMGDGKIFQLPINWPDALEF